MKKRTIIFSIAVVLVVTAAIVAVFALRGGKHPGEPEMVFVEGGTFIMGCTSEQGSDCEPNESPNHSVTLSDFYISKYEVTQAQWEAVMKTSIRQQRDKALPFFREVLYAPDLDTADLPIFGEGPDYPMYYVSWEEAQEFATRLSQLTGKEYRLPTEAEWEYAARGGNKSKGYKYSGGNMIEQVAWYSGNSGEKTHPVGKKQPNELGLHDMSGNVWEWCYDRGGEYGSGSQTDPTGSASGKYRVARGGGCDFDAAYCRVSNRSNDAPSNRFDNLGFRLVCPR